MSGQLGTRDVNSMSDLEKHAHRGEREKLYTGMTRCVKPCHKGRERVCQAFSNMHARAKGANCILA